jgi:hypothetical protein
MKKLITLLCCLPIMAVAQTVVSDSTSSATTNARAAANNAGNAQSITFNSPGGLTYGGSYSVKTTGAAILPGFAGSFSGDYCGSTMGAAGGGMGFAFSLGAPYIDESCVLLRSYERTMQAAANTPIPEQAFVIRAAALEILAEVNPKVRIIFERKGLVDVTAKPGTPPTQ